MDFRKAGINNRGYLALDERIFKERDSRLRWNKRFAKIKEDPDHAEYSWRVNFERQYEESLKQMPYKPPEVHFKPRAKLDKIDPKRFESSLRQMGVDTTAPDVPQTYRLKVAQMYAPDEKDKELIFHGLSKEHEGRYQYLKRRTEYNPEVKYPFPLTSTMYYGWNMYDVNNRLIKRNEHDEMFNMLGKLNPNKNALRNVVSTEFFRTNGALSIDDIKRAKFTKS
jgi:hypothetical protein